MDLFDQLIAELEALALSSEPRRQNEPTLEQQYSIVRTGAVRKLARTFSSEFSALPWVERTTLVQQSLVHGSNRVAHLGVFLLGLSIHEATFLDAPALDAMVSAFRGWSVTDAFCIEVLQPLLIRFPSELLSLTERWAQNQNQWKQRASVVIFVRKIGASGAFTRPGLDACERLIADSTDLVRKGVGWALKDLMRGDQVTVLDYVLGLRRRGVSSVVTLYALRDIRGKERQRILAIKG